MSVVGSGGFLGGHITRLLVERGHVVHEFGRSEPPVTLGEVDPRIAVSDHVVWAASSVNPMIAENDPDRIELDLLAFHAYVTAVAGVEHGPRTILLSSGGAVYDQMASPPYAESSPVVPRTAYGRTKIELENRLLEHDDAGLVLRVSNAYGPGQTVAPGQGVVAHWIHAIAAGQEIHIFGDPEVARDYVYAEDIASALVAAVEQDFRGQSVLNIGSGTPTTLRELHSTIAAACGGDAPRPRPLPARGFDARSTWLDCSLAESELGWRPRVSLRDGIERTWALVSREVSATLLSVPDPQVPGDHLVKPAPPLASERTT
ncbi:NAD-dependent epimerase/dehydratase family protein [Cellulomonas sp. URHB0016]